MKSSLPLRGRDVTAEGLRRFLAAVLLNGSQKKVLSANSVCSSEAGERYTPYNILREYPLAVRTKVDYF